MTRMKGGGLNISRYNVVGHAAEKAIVVNSYVFQ
jgi:hypothetical protein